MRKIKEGIVLVGGGGHCKSCIDVIEQEGRFRIAGIVDVKEKIGRKVLEYRIIAGDDELPELAGKHKNFLITIGQIKTPSKRMEKFECLKKIGARFPAVISPLAHLSRHASVEEGVIVMHKAVINAGARIGRNCIINTGAIVEHDAKIGDHCHISTGCVVNGECRIGKGVFLGSNCVISNDISIADGAVIGAGCVVVNSIDQSGLYAGNPSGRLR